MNISELRERPERSQITVSALNEYIRAAFDQDRFLSSVSVLGEISNFKFHTSGHLYFTLKDAGGEIRAVMFRSSAASLRFRPEDGMRVVAHGSVGVYVKGGTYQLYITGMQPDGVGALYLAFEQRKRALAAEGLFDAARKKPIPRYPRSIGVITSPTGAAVRDVIRVAGRRFPFAKILVCPALVQGDGAEESLVRALDYLDRMRCVDVIVIGRGGGSIEDLWAFNGEKLARKIASVGIPVISAVGHETDFTICDFVADLRAPTPSAAAEIAVPDRREVLFQLDLFGQKCRDALLRSLERCEANLSDFAARPCLLDAESLFAQKESDLSGLFSRLQSAATEKIEKSRVDLAVLGGKLDALSPFSVLARGYALAEKDGKILRSVRDVAPGDRIDLRLADGELRAEVCEKIKKKASRMSK